MNDTPINNAPTLPTRQVFKSPGTRLLDLLAGWGRFVATDEISDNEQAGLIDVGLDASELADWYQSAAAEIMEMEGEAEAEAVRRWVLEVILPTLLRTATPTTLADSVSIAA